MVKTNRRKRQRGTEVIEFALVAPFIGAMMFGSFVLGLGMVKMIQAQQVTRNAGILFMKFVDLTTPSNQDIVIRTAKGLNLQRTPVNTGNGLTILSQILYIGDTECTTAGRSANSSSCPNWHNYVFTKRVYIGNRSLTNNGATLASRLGSPPDSLLATDGNITVTNYITNTSARLSWIPTTLNLNYGEISFIGESWFTMPEMKFPGWQTLVDQNPTHADYVDNAVYAIYVT